MNTSLNEALAHLNLQPGKPYRTTVNGQEVEVRVVEKPERDEPSQFADQVMLDPWFVMPKPRIMVNMKAQFGSLPLPDPPIIPDEDIG
jgi:hypothetical protein